jgi:hypothetical protein
MDCRTCEPTLIDLLHGELATDAAEEARAHLTQCSSCRGSMDKLAEALRVSERIPLLEPPQAVSARLMQLAEEQARTFAAQRQVAVRKPPSLWQRLLDFVGRFAMARQVGMATIMLLIVAVGVWSVPSLRREPAVAGGTVVNPDPTGEAAPSAGVQPAQPLDLQVDLRTRRIRSKEEESRMRAEEQRAVAVIAKPAEPAAAKGNPAAALDDLDRPELENAAAARASGASKRAVAAKAAPATDGRGQAELMARTAATASPAAEAALPAPYPAASGGAARSDSTPAVPKSASDPYALGVERARAGDPSGALQAYRLAQSQTTDAGLRRKAELGSARALAELRGCAGALASYQQLVDSAPVSAEAGEALLEMARCRTQRGETGLARELLERAERIPQAARRAAAMLATLPPVPQAKPGAASKP